MKYAMLVAVILSGCSAFKPPERPPPAPLETVKVVYLGTTHEVGIPDDYTIIEFPDGTRERRSFHLGKVGDTFQDRKR